MCKAFRLTTKFIEYSKYIQEGLIMAECATDLLVKKKRIRGRTMIRQKDGTYMSRSTQDMADIFMSRLP